MSSHREITGAKANGPRRAAPARRRAQKPAREIKRSERAADGPSLPAGFLAACQPLANDLARQRTVFLVEPNAVNVHALRGAARRLRATLWLFEAALSPRDAAWVRRELKWLTRRLGALRDLDVLLGRITQMKPARYCPETRPEDLLLGLANLAHGERVSAAVAALRSARATILVDGFEAWLFEAAADLDTSAAAGSLARPALRDLDAEIRAMGRHVTRLRASRRHALRGKIKTLRYAAEAFTRDLRREASDPYLSALVDLSHVLGDLNDDAVGAALADRLAPECAKPGQLADKAKLRAAWAAFKAATPPWTTDHAKQLATTG